MGVAAMMRQRLNITEIQRYLGGIRYPASKSDLIDTAKSNNAPPPVIDILNRMPDKKFEALNQIEEEFGKMR